MPTDTQVRKVVQERLDSLRPSVKEYEVLTDVAKRLGNGSDYKSPRNSGSKSKAGRPKGSRNHGKSLADQVATLVSKNPDGIQVTEIAKRKDKTPGYIYSIVRQLKDDGKVKREKGRVFPS